MVDSGFKGFFEFAKFHVEGLLPFNAERVKVGDLGNSDYTKAVVISAAGYHEPDSDSASSGPRTTDGVSLSIVVEGKVTTAAKHYFAGMVTNVDSKIVTFFPLVASSPANTKNLPTKNIRFVISDYSEEEVILIRASNLEEILFERPDLTEARGILLQRLQSISVQLGAGPVPAAVTSEKRGSDPKGNGKVSWRLVGDKHKFYLEVVASRAVRRLNDPDKEGVRSQHFLRGHHYDHISLSSEANMEYLAISSISLQPEGQGAIKFTILSNALRLRVRVPEVNRDRFHRALLLQLGQGPEQIPFGMFQYYTTPLPQTHNQTLNRTGKLAIVEFLNNMEFLLSTVAPNEFWANCCQDVKGSLQGNSGLGDPAISACFITEVLFVQFNAFLEAVREEPFDFARGFDLDDPADVKKFYVSKLGLPALLTLCSRDSSILFCINIQKSSLNPAYFVAPQSSKRKQASDLPDVEVEESEVPKEDKKKKKKKKTNKSREQDKDVVAVLSTAASLSSQVDNSTKPCHFKIMELLNLKNESGARMVCKRKPCGFKHDFILSKQLVESVLEDAEPTSYLKKCSTSAEFKKAFLAIN